MCFFLTPLAIPNAVKSCQLLCSQHIFMWHNITIIDAIPIIILIREDKNPDLLNLLVSKNLPYWNSKIVQNHSALLLIQDIYLVKSPNHRYPPPPLSQASSPAWCCWCCPACAENCSTLQQGMENKHCGSNSHLFIIAKARLSPFLQHCNQLWVEGALCYRQVALGSKISNKR